MSKANILVVEDERDLSRALQYSLRREGYRVRCFREAEKALPVVRDHPPDLIILDIMLPGIDGLEFCRILRAESQVPIIFLTAKKDELDRVLGFRLGGDDFVTKPYSVREVLERVAAILRRAGPRRAPDGDGARRFGRLEVDVLRRDVRVDGRAVRLTPYEFDLLKNLVEAGGQVLSRADLLGRIWGSLPESDLETRTVDQHIARLRRKLGPEGGRIVTVTRLGYRLQVSP